MGPFTLEITYKPITNKVELNWKLQRTCLSFPVLPNVCLMPVCRMLDSPSMLKRYRSQHTFLLLNKLFTRSWHFSISHKPCCWISIYPWETISSAHFTASVSWRHPYVHISSVMEPHALRSHPIKTYCCCDLHPLHQFICYWTWEAGLCCYCMKTTAHLHFRIFPGRYFRG